MLMLPEVINDIEADCELKNLVLKHSFPEIKVAHLNFSRLF